MTAAANLPKIVAHQSNGEIVKGFLLAPPLPKTEDILDLSTDDPFQKEIQVQVVGSGKTETLALASLKALFFVRTFEGNKNHQEMKFFNSHPPLKGLWVRIRFFDGETLEGVTRNSIDLLRKNGFLLKPPDPESNNDVVYANKEALTDFLVLGVRTDY